MRWKKGTAILMLTVLSVCAAALFLPGEIRADGRRNVLCKYAAWNIEYIECTSWDEALRLLSEKKVDLVGSAQFSEERAKVYQYASLPSGYI